MHRRQARSARAAYPALIFALLLAPAAAQAAPPSLEASELKPLAGHGATRPGASWRGGERQAIMPPA